MLAEAQFRRYERAFGVAVKRRSDQVPDLINFATPRRQAEDRLRVRQMHSQGIVLKGTPRWWVKDVSTVAGRARVRFCELDNASYYVYAATGKLVNRVSKKWEPLSVRMLQRNGRWQVDAVNDGTFSCKGAT